MDRIRAILEGQLRHVADSIAFWPTFISILFVSLAVVMRYIKGSTLFDGFVTVAPWLLVSDRSVSFSLLTTLIGGLISLMVFSFPMVMVLLSNATSNLTPRLLPSLVGSRRHQVVLGFYLGTILYSIVTAMGLGLNVDDSTPPSVSVAFAVIFGIICLVLFIYFIHGVSSSIQIGVILRDIHADTLRAMGRVRRHNEGASPNTPPNFDHWSVYTAPRSGFFAGVDRGALPAFAKKHESRFVVTAIRGCHYLKGEELLRIDPGGLDDRRARILDNMVQFSQVEDVDDYFVHGLTRTVESAQKVLSPGINDPGTALRAIDYLTDLMVELHGIGEWECLSNDLDETLVWVRIQSWSYLAKLQVRDLSTYGTSDPTVMAHIGVMLRKLGKLSALTEEERGTLGGLVREIEPAREAALASP